MTHVEMFRFQLDSQNLTPWFIGVFLLGVALGFVLAIQSATIVRASAWFLFPQFRMERGSASPPTKSVVPVPAPPEREL